MGDSKIKEEVYIGNPRLPGSGIDAIFQQSDQRYLFRRCSCGEFTCAEESFPECVHLNKDGTGFIACNKCDKPVGLNDVEWVPKIRDKEIKIVGYNWSQLSSASNDPAEILYDFNHPFQGNLADVCRLRLGRPYAAIDDMLTIDRVYRCCGNDTMPTYHSGPCAMGIDVGKTAHITIGQKVGDNFYKVIKFARVKLEKIQDWNHIHDLAKRFNVKSAVIDIRPYEDAARTFQKAEPYKIYLCEYTENSVMPTDFNSNTGIVKQNRTEICDTTHRIIEEERIQFPRRNTESDIFYRHFCNIAKSIEKNKKTGVDNARYKPLGNTKEDHGRHSLNYFILACRNVRRAVLKLKSKRPQFAICNTRS